MMLRHLYGMLAPRGTRSRLTVFIFHRVLPAPDALFPGEAWEGQFERQMQWVRTWFNVLPLPEAVQRMRRGSLPACAAAITFDDGYADNYTIALPILQRLQLPATVFVATGFLDGGCMWNDVIIEAIRSTTLPQLELARLGGRRLPVSTTEEKRAAIAWLLPQLKYLAQPQREDLSRYVAEIAGSATPRNLMMSKEEVRRMHVAGMSIGAHTVSHPILASIDDASARREIEESRAVVREITGEPASLFAYPNGKPIVDYQPRHVEMVRQAGFTAAFSTSAGSCSGRTDPFQLPRFTPWERSAGRWAYRLAVNLCRSGVQLQPQDAVGAA